MRKTDILLRVIFYGTFILNTVNHVLDGFDVLYWITAALVAVAAAIDIVMAIKRRRNK